MPSSLLKYVAATVLATVHFSASASLIDPLEYKSNGLTWLQLSETAGLSLNDFATGVGGWNTQYRFALNSEIDGLLGSFGLNYGDTGHQETGNRAGDFVFAIGGVTQSGANGTYFNNGVQGALGRGLGRFAWAEISSGDLMEPLGPNCGAFTVCTRFVANDNAQPLNTRSDEIGLFLVRQERIEPPVSVPEPSTLALLSVGAAIVLRRRKTQK